jgi:hypothetical protein
VFTNWSESRGEYFFLEKYKICPSAFWANKKMFGLITEQKISLANTAQTFLHFCPRVVFKKASVQIPRSDFVTEVLKSDSHVT